MLLDRSGSLNGQDRLVNVKAAAHTFVDLLTGHTYSGSQITWGSLA